MAAFYFAGHDIEFVLLAVGLGIDMADELILGKHGQSVVTAHAFGGGGVHFPSVFEIPNQLGDFTIID